jgi:hypothetical protein
MNKLLTPHSIISGADLVTRIRVYELRAYIYGYVCGRGPFKTAEDEKRAISEAKSQYELNYKNNGGSMEWEDNDFEY